VTDETLLIFHLRPARAKARLSAEAEALSLLQDLGAHRAAGGPLSERGAIFWMWIPSDVVDQAAGRLPLLGYTHAVDLARRLSASDASRRAVRWRNQVYRLVRLYEESPAQEREQAPDRRVFELETRTGEVRRVRGYRGDSRPLKRRGLPAYDARALVTLAAGAGGVAFLDPFAGAGGIVAEGVKRGCRAVSCDLDPALRYGLKALGAVHVVADARRLPFAAAAFDAIATEPPYEPEARDMVAESLRAATSVLRPGGRIAMLCAEGHRDELERTANRAGLTLVHNEDIDRKGSDCALLVWSSGQPS
jgi:16S rRNA G966 N2-methylase RsmD